MGQTNIYLFVRKKMIKINSQKILKYGYGDGKDFLC